MASFHLSNKTLETLFPKGRRRKLFARGQQRDFTKRGKEKKKHFCSIVALQREGEKERSRNEREEEEVEIGGKKGGSAHAPTGGQGRA